MPSEVPMGSASGSPSTSPLSGRAESKAYPRTNSFLTKMQWYLRQNSKIVLGILATVMMIVFLSSELSSTTDYSKSLRTPFNSGKLNSFGGAVSGGYFKPEQAIKSATKFKFAALTDLDQLSRIEGDEPNFKSIVQPGVITYDSDANTYTLDWKDAREITTEHNEAGRGAEFSELQIFDDRLMTFDDRTGGVFEIRNKPDGKNSFTVPRFIVTEGDGETGKGMKWEWATVKDGELYMGSMGKEYTRPDGSIKNTNNLWVSILGKKGELRRVDWKKQFGFVREKLGASSPGYLVHEAINWSSYKKRWVFLPRRVSTLPYNDVEDESRGSNKALLVDEHFTTSELVTVKMASKDGLHGFSSFAFVPGTEDNHVLALRTVEENCTGDDLNACRQMAFAVIFDLTTGEVLMDEIPFPGENRMKFEGVEFVDIFTKP